MKRIIVLLLGAALIIALPVSHLLIADESVDGALGQGVHGSAAVAGQGSIGAGWNPVNNRKPRGAVQPPRRASSSYPETALSGHERAGI